MKACSSRQLTYQGPFSDFTQLPSQVAQIRAKILDACATGDIERLRIPIDWNEVRPLFEREKKHPAGSDPIETLKSLSFDAKGSEILTLLQNALNQPYAVQHDCVSTLYIFPALAVIRPASGLGPESYQSLWSCVRFSDLARSGAFAQPPIMSAAFGQDGVWHYFWSN